MKEEYICRFAVHGLVEPFRVSDKLICPVCRSFLSKEPILVGEGGGGLGIRGDTGRNPVREFPSSAPPSAREVQ